MRERMRISTPGDETMQNPIPKSWHIPAQGIGAWRGLMPSRPRPRRGADHAGSLSTSIGAGGRIAPATPPHHPAKDAIMTAQAFWDRHAPKYAKQPIAEPTAYEEKLRRVTALLRPTDHVLEVGCGTGGTAQHLARFAAHVTATDLSGEMIRIAKARSEGSAAEPDLHAGRRL